MGKKILNYIPVITMFPAIMIGTLTMYLNSVSPSIYMQNILCFVMLVGTSYFLLKSKYNFFETKPVMLIIIGVMALVFTFINSGVEGVHRWISLGPIRLYVSAIVLPMIIINIWSLLKKGKRNVVIVSIICVSIILTLQPDASMMTAFSITSMILLWRKVKRVPYFLIMIFLGSSTIFTWVFIDGLASVEHVEGIFKLVADMGWIWFILGVISLATMIIPFFIFPPNENKILSICFGIYFIIILTSSVFGNFPIPLMGYGVSPIIGYFISITWFTKTKINSLH